jgi:LemA protein
MKSALLVLAVILGLVFVLLIGGCSSYNRIVSLSEPVEKQWAQVENAYQRRLDLIPNLVKTVEAEATFEKSTLTEIANARSAINQIRLAPGQIPDEEMMKKFDAAQSHMSGALGRMMAISENYPTLKASQGFRDLSSELAGTENRINVERNRFNETAQDYNVAIKRMPAALYAGMFGFHPKPYFKSSAGAEDAPKVEFNFSGSKPATK